jgi:hypothetical protein
LLKQDPDTGKIELMNITFASFILLDIKGEDLKMIEKQTQDKGTWNNFRIPVFIIIIGLIVVLISAQPRSFTSIFAYVSAFAAGMNLLQRFLLFFNFKSAK